MSESTIRPSTSGEGAGATEGRIALQQRTLRVLVVAQVLGGLGLAAGVAVGALLARELQGGDAALAGVPAAAATVGGALAAVPIARWMSRSGRRPGLVAGYVTGAAGAVLVVAAAQVRSFPLLLLGMLLFGVGNTSTLLSRYAAADLAEPAGRGRAVSAVLFATTFGAVAGPNLVEPTGALAVAVSLPRLTGPFLLSLAAYACAAVVVAALLRPDPLLAARGATAAPVGRVGLAWGHVLHGPALAGLVAMVGAQLVMVAMMTMTPVHMLEHDHGLGVIGFVIGVHIAGMFAFAPAGGLLVDRFGSATTIRAGAATLLAAGVAGALADPDSVPVLTLALFLLGLGWSLCLVGGTTMLTAAVPLPQRAAAQGSADLLVGLAGAAGGLGSGLALALSGFTALALFTAAIATALLASAARPGPRPAAQNPG